MAKKQLEDVANVVIKSWENKWEKKNWRKHKGIETKKKNIEAHQKHNQHVDNKINAVQSEFNKQRETISEVVKNVSGLEERVEKVEKQYFFPNPPIQYI